MSTDDEPSVVVLEVPVAECRGRFEEPKLRRDDIAQMVALVRQWHERNSDSNVESEAAKLETRLATTWTKAQRAGAHRGLARLVTVVTPAVQAVAVRRPRSS